MKPQKWAPHSKQGPNSGPAAPQLLPDFPKSWVIIQGRWVTSSKGSCCLFSRLPGILFLMKPPRWMWVHRIGHLSEFLRNPVSLIVSAHNNFQRVHCNAGTKTISVFHISSHCCLRANINATYFFRHHCHEMKITFAHRPSSLCFQYIFYVVIISHYQF